MNKTLFYFFLLFAFSFANLKTAKAQKLDNEAVFKEYNRIAGYKKLKRKNLVGNQVNYAFKINF